MSLLDTASLVVTPNGTKASKLYSVVPSDGSGDLTVTRATTATRINSAGAIESVATNVPRLDYSNGSCPSILVEPQRTNLRFYSERLISGFGFDFAGGVFTVTEDTTDTLDPFGTNKAEKFNTTSANNNDIYPITLGSGNISYSIFAKKGTSNTITLFHVNVTTSNTFEATFNLNTGTITSTSGTVTAKIQALNNGWYRCSITGADTLSSGNIFRTLTNIGTSYLFGQQLEQGSYVTSYIPTDTSSVTRIADSVNKTGISNLIGQTEGTILFDFYYNGESKDLMPIELYNGSSRIDFYIGNKLLYFEFSTGAFLSYPTTLVKGRYKICGSYKLNDFTLYVNGVQVDTESTGTVPTCSNLNINDLSVSLGTYKQQIEVNTLALWKTRLTNTQLATLTTI
jgi:hypothetical protein